MRYSWVTMRQALKDVGVSKGVNPFLWEEAQKVNPHLAAQFKHGRGKNFLNDMLEYCLLAYSKAIDASGPQLIGRQDDLWVAEKLDRAGISVADKQTLWDPHTKGNIQVLDKWAPVINDCWVLGGVHRRAAFELVSMRTLENLWHFANEKKDPKDKARHVVTAREILGLLNFGYSVKRQADKVTLVCADASKADTATIQAYTAFMTGKEQTGPDSIRAILVLDPNLKKDIEGFDRSKLKHVVPPR
jgi:hypothetical protein